MKLTTQHYALFAFTIAYIVAGTSYLLADGNMEFLIYVGILIVVLGLALWMQLRFNIPIWMLWLVTFLGALHLAGGGIKIEGDLLYNYIVFPIVNNGAEGITLLRFDQLVHPYGTGIAGLIIYYLLARVTKLKRRWIALVAALAAMGIGSLNEVVEFGAKMLIPNTDVGGYTNTALDFCSNLVGSLIGTFIGTRPWERHEVMRRARENQS